MNESAIFLAAVQIEEPQIRDAFLDSVCKSNFELRQRILKKLDNYGKWIGAWDGFSSNLAEKIIELSNDENGKLDENRTAEDNHSETDASNTLSAGTQVGTYKILSCLGVGGMGEVYLAYDERLERRVALKLLPLRYSHTPQWVQRFEREAKAASALNHPNILTIFEISSLGDTHFIASEYVSGQSLRSLINVEMTLEKKLDLGIQIAEALNAAHSANIVHRDIKPENIMVRPDGLVKVLDFGIAKFYSPSRPSRDQIDTEYKTDPGIIMGTIRYMSPEQARRLSIDFRADLFSFGVVMFEFLTGMLPFHSKNDTKILTSLISDEPLQLKPLSQISQYDLESCIKKLLRKDPEERYQSAKELLVDLKQARRQLERSSDDSRLHTSTDDNRINASADTDHAFATNTKIEIPEVRYARSGDVNIAYQIVGSGDLDLVFVMGWVSHLDWFWKEPSFAKFLMRLASIARLIIFDKRGTAPAFFRRHR